MAGSFRGFPFMVVKIIQPEYPEKDHNSIHHEHKGILIMEAEAFR